MLSKQARCSHAARLSRELPTRSCSMLKRRRSARRWFPLGQIRYRSRLCLPSWNWRASSHMQCTSSPIIYMRLLVSSVNARASVIRFAEHPQNDVQPLSSAVTIARGAVPLSKEQDVNSKRQKSERRSSASSPCPSTGNAELLQHRGDPPLSRVVPLGRLIAYGAAVD